MGSLRPFEHKERTQGRGQETCEPAVSGVSLPRDVTTSPVYLLSPGQTREMGRGDTVERRGPRLKDSALPLLGCNRRGSSPVQLFGKHFLSLHSDSRCSHPQTTFFPGLELLRDELGTELAGSLRYKKGGKKLCHTGEALPPSAPEPASKRNNYRYPWATGHSLLFPPTGKDRIPQNKPFP